MYRKKFQRQASEPIVSPPLGMYPGTNTAPPSREDDIGTSTTFISVPSGMRTLIGLQTQISIPHIYLTQTSNCTCQDTPLPSSHSWYTEDIRAPGIFWK